LLHPQLTPFIAAATTTVKPGEGGGPVVISIVRQAGSLRALWKLRNRQVALLWIHA